MVKPNKKQVIEQFVNACSMVFKSYEYDVVISKNKANLWHFAATKKDKKFVVYCAPDLKKVQGIIKVALKKVPGGSKLVVICSKHNEEDQKKAEEGKYKLIELGVIRKFGTDMIEATTREEA